MFDKQQRAIERINAYTQKNSKAYKKLRPQFDNLSNSANNIKNQQDYNDAMTQLRMATGINGTEAEKMMTTYSNLGSKLKATGVDVATSSTEWLKQGKSIKQASALAENSIILSKIGSLSSEDSTKYLTSAMKGYKVDKPDDVLGIVDKISAVDMASATDVGGLAQGMSEVAANADLAGVSMSKLLGYLATIGETTQEGMGSVGTSLNAVFSRMGNIKLSRLKDYQNESGEDLSDVETVLRGNKISLRDSTGEFRNFGDTLTEVMGKWDKYGSVQQRAIAKAFAGTHHMNDFIILMENSAKAQEYENVANNSSGSAMKKYDVYKDSLQGATEGVKNEFQKLSSTVLDDGFLKTALSGVSSLIKGFNDLISTVGTVQSLLLGIGAIKLFSNLD